ncbi:acyltransferase family protein [Streptomyces sp. NPDC056144]|uniref:acyltransferase family protein n=1 Tax=unclassified Streptomyces TaxID=2593676 RepID=UPI0035D9245D
MSSLLRPGPAATVPVAPGVTRRDPYFDNVKYLAMLLVVLGHALTVLLDGSRTARTLYTFLYVFHMPVFVLISGHLSRSYTGRPAQLRRLLTGVALPYLLFEAAYTLLTRWGREPERPFSLLHPTYVMWFLLALFVWRVTAPFWAVVRWPVAVSVGIAALAWVTPGLGGVLGVPRILQFLPFFVIGLRMRPEHFRFLRRRPARVAAVVAFVVALPVAYGATARDFPPSFYRDMAWIFRTMSVQELGEDLPTGLFKAAALFVCAALLTAAFLALVPGRELWFTVLGSGTICAYLLHGFLIQGGKDSGFFDLFPWLRTAGGLVFFALVTLAVTTALCTPPVRGLLKPVTEPEMSWAFRRDAR